MSPGRKISKYELKSIGRLEVWDGIIESENEDGTQAFQSQNQEFRVIRINKDHSESFDDSQDEKSESSEVVEFMCDRRFSEMFSREKYIKVTIDRCLSEISIC